MPVVDNEVIKKLDTFFSQFPTFEFKKGATIIHAGQTPNGVYYVKSGVIRSYWMSAEGTEVTQNMFKPHSFLPMSWAIAGIENNCYYDAMTDVLTNRAPKEAVLTFLKKEPDVIYDLLRRIYIGLEGLWMHMESLTTGNSATKLAASLFILVKRFGKKAEADNAIIELKMNEKDIASYAGMTRETTSRELQKLKKENIVDFQKGVVAIKDIKKLESMLLA